MNLFVCYTHLQLVIASRIIAHRNLLPDDVELFYISKIDNDVTKNTLQDMREICGKVTFIHMKLKYPLYFPVIFRHFFKRCYDAVFVSSIDNILIHFILSRVSFEHLYTFDDGSANIIPGSIYYQDPDVRFFIRIYRFILMIHYNILNVKQRSQCHYTIYPQHKNIISNTIPINFTSISTGDEGNVESAGLKKSSCNVMIGAVYASLFGSEKNIRSNLNKCWSILKSEDRDTFYLPHPRERTDYTPDYIRKINAKYIAEQEIIMLLKEYEYVYLYGFLSSCQINLAYHPKVVNRIFYSTALSPAFNNAIKSQSYNSFEIIDINEAEK
ncbi:glycosyltransferase family 52 [Aeromonas veronii]|uniref:glycosyltransferase family 52 n=1 Tax=Aeromonas veronii TaxID=654 RepID=UPI003BA00A0A